MSELKSCKRCDTNLEADTIEGLCPRCLMALNFDTRTMPQGEEAAPSSPLSPEEMSEYFPQFEILEYLGRGGMGVVYQARQKALDRLVAIKILAGEWQGDSNFAARFEREAKTLAQMSHPNIVTIHDFGEKEGLYYIVMEYINGVNLRDLLKERKLEPEQALSIVPPICEALEFAHSKGVVHRDIKPENLLLDREGRIKIADFGIASLIGTSTEKSGTPPYMAPEQQEGQSDERADIYALGVVLYEMLTGERPGQDWLSPSQKAGINHPIDKLVRRAMHQNPEDRFQTAAEFRTSIEEQKLTEEGSPPPMIDTGKKPRGFFQRFWWILLITIPGSMILALFLSMTVVKAVPQQYEANAVVQVDHIDSSNLLESRQFFATQFEVITSKKALGTVVDKLDLDRKWAQSKEDSIATLKRSIETNQRKGTDSIEISVSHYDQTLTPELANAVASTYTENVKLIKNRRSYLQQKASIPRSPRSPFLTFLALGIGLAVGLLLAILISPLLMKWLHHKFPNT